MRSQFKFLAVLSTIPFAVLINLLRIIITAALSYFVSLSVLNMLIHELTGAITFFIALTLFVVLCEILQRHFPMRVPEPVAKSERGSLADSEKLQRSTLSAPRSWQPALLAMALFIPGVYFSANVKTQAAKSLSNDLSKVGTQLASYQLDDSKGSGFYNDPSADVEISRIYSTAQSAPIELYIGFKSKQQGEKRLKSPRLGFPYGWNYVWIEPARIAADNPSISIDANWMLTQSGQSRVLVLYWFQTGEYTVGGEFGKRMLQIRNALLHSRSDGAVVRLAMAVNSPDHMEEAKRRLSEFAAGLYPRLREVLPL
jgi:EpsI family protein